MIAKLLESIFSSLSIKVGETSHDKLFKTVIYLFIQDLLELLHPALAANLDFSQLKLADKDLFTDFRKSGHLEPDVVIEVRTLGPVPRDVLLHAEVETRFRKTIHGRTSYYSMHLTMRSGKPVISIVIFLSGGPEKGIEHCTVLEEVEPWEIRRFRYLALALSRCLAENYVGRPQPLASALAALMPSKIWDKVEQKLRCLRAISQFKDLDVARQFVLARIVDTYLQLDEDETLRFAAELERETAKEVHEMAITWEETLAEREEKGLTAGKVEGLATGKVEGFATGKVEGLATGKAEGTLQGVRKAIGLFMKHRCNLTPAEEGLLAEKLEAVHDLHRLYEILEQAGEARSLDDLDFD